MIVAAETFVASQVPIVERQVVADEQDGSRSTSSAGVNPLASYSDVLYVL